MQAGDLQNSQYFEGMRRESWRFDVFDESTPSDTGVKHAWVLATGPDGSRYVVDPWKNETRVFNPQQYVGTRGVLAPQANEENGIQSSIRRGQAHDYLFKPQIPPKR